MSKDNAQHAAVGLADTLRILVSPAQVYRRVEDTGAYGMALLVLLGGLALLGYVQIQTGLIDRVVDIGIQKEFARLEAQQLQLVDRARFEDHMEDIHKSGEFSKRLLRIQALVLRPTGMLAGLLVTSSILYAFVALSGRKPEFHTLMSICVYAAFILLGAEVLEVLMMVYYRTLHVDASLAMLADEGKPTALAAVNPFVVWFWALVAAGLIITRQLGRRSALIASALLCSIALAIRVGTTYVLL